MNPIGHIDMRVRDMKKALPFFSALLPKLGFSRIFPGEEWTVFAAEGDLPSAPFIGITEATSHVPNENRIAFWASNREEVDALAAVVREAGGTITDGPEACPEYSPSYYAVFFEDPSGNRFEVVYRVD